MAKKKKDKKLVQKITFTDSIIKAAKEKFKFLKKKGKLKELNFLINNHIPVPCERPRRGKWGFYVPNAAKNKKAIRAIIEPEIPSDFEQIHCEVKIQIECYMPMLANFSKKDLFLAEHKVIRPIVKPDVDNLAKTYMDALSGLIWTDDALVTELLVKKYYSFVPKVIIKIKYRNILYSSIFSQYQKKSTK